MANRATSLIPTDPLFKEQWFLKNTGQQGPGTSGFDINVTKVWPDYSGVGVLIAAFDDGFDESHPDLMSHYRKDLSWNFLTKTAGAQANSIGEDHGTAVIGLMGEVANNDIGGVGVAWGSMLVGYKFGITSTTASAIASEIKNQYVQATQKAVQQNVQILNNSWGNGFDAPFKFWNLQTDYWTSNKYLADNGRNGLGTVNLFSSGNGRMAANDSNADPTMNSPFVIAVAASAADGTITSYSTAGANVLIASPGSDPASIISTDRQGSDGYNQLEGAAGNYTNIDGSYFNGTSAAAPIASGVVGLMLQANPYLGYRDVQDILVYSSSRANHLASSSVKATYNATKDWNGGGLLTSNDFGFGNIDALAAVRMAESWSSQNTSSNLNIIDGVIASTAKTLTVQPLATISGSTARYTGALIADFTADARVEHMTVTINLSAKQLENVNLVLISPSGTESMLIDRPLPLDKNEIYYDLPDQITYTLSTTRNWGEDISGKWGLVVVNRSLTDPVTINDWSIKGYTSAQYNHPHPQIFTNEYANFIALQSERSQISSTNGKDINASAVSASSNIDLSVVNSNIGGVNVSLSDPQNFKNIIGGDGNDRLIGNALDNLLMGGRGNNIIDGGAGVDIAKFIGGRSFYNVSNNGDTFTIQSNVLSQGGIDTVYRVEKFQFGQTILVARSALDQTSTVASMYDALFNRGADAGGLKTWTNSILIGSNSELNVARAFVQSTEDNVNALSNGQFVTRMYNYALDRAPDIGGYNNWVNALNAQQVDRGQALMSFIKSQEFVANRVDVVATQIAGLGDIWV